MENKKGGYSYYPQYKEVGSHIKDNLINGDFDRVRDTIELEKSGDLERGSILGKNEKGKYEIIRVASGSGANSVKAIEPSVILAEDVDTKTVNKQVVYLTGEFNTRSLNFNKVPVQEVKEKLRKYSIFISESQPLVY